MTHELIACNKEEGEEARGKEKVDEENKRRMWNEDKGTTRA